VVDRRPQALALGLWLAFACSDVDDPTLRLRAEARHEVPSPELRRTTRAKDRNLYWGDLHIHTSFSFDAYTFGVRALPDDAYEFAKGRTIQHAIGYPIRLSSPLDFAAVTDHAEYLGVARSLGEADPEDPSLREVLETASPLRITWYFLRQVRVLQGIREGGGDLGPEGREISRSAWGEILAAAERHNQPGRFTTFVGYEWTSMPDDRNLHRNVIYRDAHAPVLPFTSLESEDPEDLWRALDAQRALGMQMIAIPHNGNVSGGLMYDRVAYDGSPFDEQYAETRMRNEPISEILQVKGQSEVHPLLASEDEFAEFEVFDQLLSATRTASEPAGSYARDALKTGLELSMAQGLNPYRFGVIGSSDSHNASSSVEEDDYHGKLPLQDGSVGLRLGTSLLLPEGRIPARRWGAAGLAAIWAQENTRASLYDAMLRKETYATSGPRIAVRFFGGFDFTEGMLADPGAIAKAYATGVPMGGELEAQGGRPPRFLVMALRDPSGANLDRVQIVKGWVDAAGQSHEKIFDVAASDGRRSDPTTHRVPALESTVERATASYQNSIGAPKLSALWRDPEYDPSQEAFYYARVLEISTPRWSTYDAVALGVAPIEPAEIQERAITSAIWVSP